MNFGMMRHADEKGVKNLRKSLKAKIARDIDKLNIPGGEKKFLKSSIQSYVRDLEDISRKLGAKYYTYQNKQEDDKDVE